MDHETQTNLSLYDTTVMDYKTKTKIIIVRYIDFKLYSLTLHGQKLLDNIQTFNKKLNEIIALKTNRKVADFFREYKDACIKEYEKNRPVQHDKAARKPETVQANDKAERKPETVQAINDAMFVKANTTARFLLDLEQPTCEVRTELTFPTKNHTFKNSFFQISINVLVPRVASEIIWYYRRAAGLDSLYSFFRNSFKRIIPSLETIKEQASAVYFTWRICTDLTEREQELQKLAVRFNLEREQSAYFIYLRHRHDPAKNVKRINTKRKEMLKRWRAFISHESKDQPSFQVVKYYDVKIPPKLINLP